MRHALTALLTAGAICAFAPATLASAQLFGTSGAPPAPVYGYTYNYGNGPTIPSQTGAPAYSWNVTGPWLAPNGECNIIAGNRVCTTDRSAFGPLFFPFGL